MDKYEYKLRADQIKQLISVGEYAQAVEIADTIDWRRVKSVLMLCTISDLYKINRRYEDARNMLLLAYERRPGGRTICYSLCELSIKMEEYVQAIEYYKEFVQVAPKDSGRYILQYKLYEAQDVSLEERIEVLEELKKRDYREKWVYELAYLYHRIGLATRCVEVCDEMILWFGDGKYVIKAMELKMLHEPLTEAQQKVYDNRFSVPSAVPLSDEINALTPGNDSVSQPVVANVPEETSEVDDATKVIPNLEGYVNTPVSVDDQATKVIEPVGTEEMDIQVKTMDMGAYNTINLQAELAQGLKEILEQDETSAQDKITQSILAPMLESDTESLDMPEIDEVDEDDLEDVEETVEDSEVFFGETAELSVVKQAVLTEEDEVEELVEIGDEVAEDEDIQIPDMVQETAVVKPEPSVHVEPPKALAGVLSQESDGQLSIVMPEKDNIVEKQITGQLSIDDILAEWERMKRDNEEKRANEVRQHVLDQTGAMFTEFEASLRDDLLNKLEAEAKKEAEEARAAAENPATVEVEEVEEVYPEEATEEATVVDTVEDEYPAEEAPVEYAEDAYPTEEAPVEYAEDEYPAEEAPEEYTEDEYPVEETTGEYVEVSEEEKYFEEEAVEEDAYPTMPLVTTIPVTSPIIPVVPVVENVEQVTEVVEAPTQEIENNDAPVNEFAIPDMNETEEDTVEDNFAIPEETGEVAADDGEVDFSYDQAEEAEADEEDDQSEEEDSKEVVRDKAKVRNLTKEERELFSTFIQNKRDREQLAVLIDGISMAAYTGNVVITGDEGMDTMTLAKNIIREVQMTDSNFSGKVAKVSGLALNKKDVMEVITSLSNGALIISKVSDVNTQTAAVLNRAIQSEDRGIILIIEDNKKDMDDFLGRYPDLAECFSQRMDLEVMNNDALALFGMQYAKEKEYTIDEMGMLALHTRIEELQTSDHVATVMDVKEIVDEAIHHANRKSVGHFFDILLAKRYDEEDMIVLREGDFI